MCISVGVIKASGLQVLLLGIDPHLDSFVCCFDVITCGIKGKSACKNANGSGI